MTFKQFCDEWLITNMYSCSEDAKNAAELTWHYQQKKIDQVSKKLEIAIEVLEFYAEESVYYPKNLGLSPSDVNRSIVNYSNTVFNDLGNKAKEALCKIK